MNHKFKSKILFFFIFAMCMVFVNVTVFADTKENDKAWQKINGVCYNGNGKAIPKAITRGIDVSVWQGDIDWAKVKADNVDFAFIRVAYGTGTLDTKYAANMKNAVAAGMPVGVYLFSTALTEEQALQEAQLVIRQLQGYKVSYPVVLDLEYSSMTRLSKEKVGKIALTFCNEIKKAGYYPMVYCNAWWYRDIIDWSYLKGIDVWIAQYGDTIMPPDSAEYKYTIWQATDGMGTLNTTKGLIDGIPKTDVVDINFGFVDYTKIITPRSKSLSTYKASTKPDLTVGLVVKDPVPTVPPKNGWITENSKTYYYKNNIKQVGWQKIDGKYYYFNTSSGYLYKDKLLISNNQNVCYVDKNGVRATETWVTWSGKRYYMGASGYAVKNFQTIDGVLYYFNKTYGYLYKNKKLTSTSGNVYYAISNGSIYRKGFLVVKENGVKSTYYFKNNGKAYKGWAQLGKKWYYFDTTSAVMKKSCTMSDENGQIYIFDSNGVCVSGK